MIEKWKWLEIINDFNGIKIEKRNPKQKHDG